MIRNLSFYWIVAGAFLFGNATWTVVYSSDPDGEESVVNESNASEQTAPKSDSPKSEPPSTPSSVPENAPSDTPSEKPSDQPAVPEKKLIIDTAESPSDDMAGTDKTPLRKESDNKETKTETAPVDPNSIPEAKSSGDERNAPKTIQSATEPKPFPNSTKPLTTIKVAENPVATPKPAPLTPEQIRLRDEVRRCLQIYYHEPITTVEYSPWGIMHALIAFGVDTEIYAGGQKVNAIGWLCYNGPCRGMKMMYVQDGKIRLRMGPGYQGHAGQFLAMLAQCRVKTDFPIRVDGQNFTVADLIESEKETCRSKTELTFKLIGLSHYLPTDATWKNDLGEDWDLPRLIREELAQPIVGAACGGTHRMTGFSYAVNKRTRLEEPFEGQWLRAQKFVNAYHKYIFTLQNPDGSFSTNWFASRGYAGDEDRRVQTTGHMLEWLVCSLPQDQLDDPRVVRTVSYLTELLLDGANRQKKWEIGPRGHAIHALALYAERRYSDKAGNRDAMLARQPSRKTTEQR